MLATFKNATTAAPDLIENHCSGNTTAGIYYSKKASGNAIRNQCNGNGWILFGGGIILWNNASPVLDANRCTENSRAGIAYWNKTSGVARNNNCINNRGKNIRLSKKAAPELVNNISV